MARGLSSQHCGWECASLSVRCKTVLPLPPDLLLEPLDQLRLQQQQQQRDPGDADVAHPHQD